MRWGWFAWMLGWAASAGAQGNTTPSSLPQAIVQVQRTQVGTDMVTITMSSPRYPRAELESQSKAIGRYTGKGVQSLGVTQVPLDPKDPSSVLVKSTFATNGLIDRPKGKLNLEPIVRAMAGVPAPDTIHDFQVDFDFEDLLPSFPGDFANSAVEIHRSVIQKSIVYDVELLTQDPSRIVLPSSNDQPKPTVMLQRPAAQTDWVVLAAFGVGAIAAGALVYSLLLVLLRPASRKGPRA